MEMPYTFYTTYLISYRAKMSLNTKELYIQSSYSALILGIGSKFFWYFLDI